MRTAYVIMGIAGCGKSTLGQALADRLACRFIDADDYHPSSNIEKMSRGIPLTDADRAPWLETLAQEIAQLSADAPVVLACSALKQQYREHLRKYTDAVQFIYLAIDAALAVERLGRRQAHFMPASLVKSQLQTLEVPNDAWVLNADTPLSDNLERILTHIRAG